VTALVLVALPQAAQAGVSVTTDATPRVNGPVYAIAQVGDLTIIGGDFTTVGGKPRANAAAIRADGTLDPGFNPSPDGIVRAVAGSADGSTVYLGGRFATAGGAPRANLAAVDVATGTALPTWQADTVGTSPGISALTTHGDRLYAGGTFSGIDGTVRASMVALDVAGDVVSSFRSRANAGVKAIRVSPDGATVYAVGSFSKIGGLDRPWGVGAIQATTGDATAWNPVDGSDLALTVGLSPDGSRLYFSTPDNQVFAYDTSSNTPVWVRKTSGDTQAIHPSATEVYIGGHFSQIVTYKIKRQFLASLNPADGTVTPWDPNPVGGTMGVWAITATDTSLMVGGTFTTVNGVERVRFARFPGTP
jgi:WD40 repeat protein